MQQRFKDQTVIVTGAAGGIGREIVHVFSREGANIVLVDLYKETMESIAHECNLPEHSTLIIEADVSKEKEIEYFVQESVRKFGNIDIFCNNAGVVGKVAKIIDMNEENFDEVFNVNVKGMYLGLKHVLKQMVKQKSGSIINTASTLGLRGAGNMSIYSASKHAVIGMTKCAALEAVDMGIRVNSVCPAPVETAMMNKIAEGVFKHVPLQESMEMYAESIPMKRMAHPLEIANLIAFLASEEASFITGSCYVLDGGKTA